MRRSATARCSGCRASTSACDEDRLVLYFQPIVPIRDGDRCAAAVRAAAAHARRERPAGAAGRVHPGGRALQPDAAARPLGGAPGVPAACAQALQDDSSAPYSITINVSTTTINDEQFLDYVIAEIADADLSPGALCFELTENDGDDQPGGRHALHPRAAQARLQVLARRLRQRPVVVHVPEEPAGRLHQDRRQLRAQRGAGHDRPQHGRGHHADRPRDGDRHHRRTRRLGRGAEPPGRTRRAVRAGPLHRFAAAGRSAAALVAGGADGIGGAESALDLKAG